MIVFDRVSVQYKKGPHTDALRDVSFTIGDGEFVFIIGDSGAGKTTLLKLLMGEETPSSGSVLVDGTDVARLHPWKKPEYRRRFGVIFQDFRLLQDMDAYENIAFAQRIVGASRRSLEKRVPKLLEKLGIEDRAHHHPSELSGGEQQRVAIARAMINGPLYLLADEPTGNLDPANSLDIIRQLEKFNENGTTVIVVTHDAAIVNTLHKRVITMKEGRIVSDCPVGEYGNGNS